MDTKYHTYTLYLFITYTCTCLLNGYKISYLYPYLYLYLFINQIQNSILVPIPIYNCTHLKGNLLKIICGYYEKILGRFGNVFFWRLLLYWQPSACRKQLRDLFNTEVLGETVMQILEIFMSTGSSRHWVNLLMPSDSSFSNLATVSSHGDETLPSVSKFDQLMIETRAVLTRYVHLPVLENLCHVQRFGWRLKFNTQ